MINNPMEKHFMVRIECGKNAMVSIRTEKGTEFDFAKLEYDKDGKCLSLKFKLKCLDHPENQESP